MVTSVGQILKTIDEFFPFKTQDQWDNSGLLIGSKSKIVDRILLALDVTDEVLEEAIEEGVDLIIVHHPILFRPVKKITTDDRIGRLIIKAIKSDIAIIAAHTNLDKSKLYGINQWIAESLNLTNTHLLIEEDEHTGHGIIGFLNQASSIEEFSDRLKTIFKINTIKTANANDLIQVRKIAIASGAASDFIEYALSHQVDAFITSDLKYHECQQVLGSKLVLFDVGHYESESVYLNHLKKILDGHFDEKNYDLFVKVTETEKPLLKYY